MLNDEVKNIWNANAAFWDSRMGEGNAFHKTLIEPTQLKMLDIKPRDKILDIACGNGQFARKMAELGAHVTAVDFSDKFIAIAAAKSPTSIQFRVIDAANEADLKKLDGNLFDSIVCTMALMDMENIEVLINHLPRLLKKDGIVVFSVMHPCFNSGEITLVHEMDDMGGELKSKYSVRISNYLVERSILGVGMAGQPKAQYYFHRPLSTILKYFFAAGFVLDALEEPSFSNIENSSRIFDNVYKHIPPALICRLRMC
jgi:2-polyprenyl-3-methyl-5-hydroxy-6-metoxy-1,4-benzoquinol methylase